MASQKDTGRGIWGTVLVAAAGILLSWAAFEIALAPVLRPSRNALNKSLDPDYDVDDEAVKKVEEVANEAKVKEKKKEEETETEDLEELEEVTALAGPDQPK